MSNTHPEAITILEKVLQENPEQIDWKALCKNPEAIPMIQKLYDENSPLCHKFYWCELCKNPSAVPFLFSDTYTRLNIKWDLLGCNPSAIDILEERIKNRKYFFIDFKFFKNLSLNPNGIPLLLNLKKIKGKRFPFFDFLSLSSNPSPLAMEILKENLNEISWPHLSANPSAINILLENPQKIIWSRLSLNPSAIDLLYEESLKEKNRLDWNALCKNPSAISLLSNVVNDNPEKN